MKAYLRQLISPAETNLIAVHLVREYLQARILQSLQRTGVMRTLAFNDGTSLQFLYDTLRSSEDLDFALDLHPEAYDSEPICNGSCAIFRPNPIRLMLKSPLKKLANKKTTCGTGLCKAMLPKNA